MFEMLKLSSSIQFKISSEARLIDKISPEIEIFLNDFGIYEPFVLIVVLRELLLNALIYGNRKNPELIVLCTVTKQENHQFKITVEDEGSGFDYTNINMSIPDRPQHLRKRGYVLINALSDRIEFNEKGNRVSAYVSANQGYGWVTTYYH